MVFKNTHKSGTIRSVIFRQDGQWFGAALEFNIVEFGTSPQEVAVLLDEAIVGYIEGAIKGKLSVSVLNQDIDPEYEALWKLGNGRSSGRDTQVYRSASQPIAALV